MPETHTAHTHHSWHNVKKVTKTDNIDSDGYETLTIWFMDGSSSHITIHYIKEEEE